MNQVGIVIVTYNSVAEIGSCLDAAAATGAKIVVVDNASADGTADEVERRGIAVIRNAENRGFAAAVNQGIRILPMPCVLLLNPDAQILSGLEHLAAQCMLPGVGAAGGRTLGADGLPQAGWMARRLPNPASLCFEILGINRVWPGNPVNWRFRCLDLDLTAMTPSEVEQPAGAFLMVRREAWERLGGFDERFHPLWFEDVDFCRRMKDAGWRLFHVPAATAAHSGAHSIRKMPLGIREIYWYGSLLRYTDLHFSRIGRVAVCCSVVAGSVIRAVGRLLKHGSMRDAAVYWKIIELAARRILPGINGLEGLS
jgi:glycosyltransferase involved in cell wall biosynthesis